MKFATVAVLATAAQATTIDINDQVVGGVVQKWQAAAQDLQNFYQQQAAAEQQALAPYVQSIQQDVQRMVDIDMQYSQVALEEAAKTAETNFWIMFNAFGC